jgi:hypothetical protein
MDVVALVIVVLVIFALVSLTGSGKTFKCKKCGFCTNDHLQAAGHVALENAHKCEEV